MLTFLVFLVLVSPVVWLPRPDLRAKVDYEVALPPETWEDIRQFVLSVGRLP